MSASDTERDSRRMMKTGLVYLCISLLCAWFGAMYEQFSHGVFSYYMIYSFAFPLAGGALPFFLLSFRGGRTPGRLPLHFYHSGVATLTVGSIFQGVLEIYGTTNPLTRVYWIVGWSFVLCGIVGFVIGRRRKFAVSKKKEKAADASRHENREV